MLPTKSHVLCVRGLYQFIMLILRSLVISTYVFFSLFCSSFCSLFRLLCVRTYAFEPCTQLSPQMFTLDSSFISQPTFPSYFSSHFRPKCCFVSLETFMANFQL